ncbi:MAG TPA: gephyrin-like molybdotransferase Glp [Myxococcota bacterium]|nr:gephyrin-like molybdotransferase Glp [Myxococcota bacterium]
MRTGISAAEALRIILDEVRPLGAETVAISDAVGRVLCEAVASSRLLPPADNSAMDGYALRADEARGADSARPAVLPIAFEIPAGDPGTRPLPAGAAARIFTGAPIPPGADSVVRQEDTQRHGDRVEIRIAPKPGDHVRRAGEDVRPGERVLEPGTRLSAAHVGMLTSLGRGFVAVHQRPRVAILSGGDELVEPDGDVAGGRIVSSNSWSIAALCRELGALPVYLGIAPDRPEEIERRLRAGLACDAIVSSAGVSVGDRDYARGVFEKLGCRLLFWGVEIKPGHPLAFGAFEGRGPLVFGLPGNPVSAVVTFEEFVRPALRRMAGHTQLFRPQVQATLGEPLRKAPGRLHFVRVRLAREGGRVVARSTGNQSSGVLRSLCDAQGLLIFPAQARELRAGDTATVQVLDEDFLAADGPGFE